MSPQLTHAQALFSPVGTATKQLKIKVESNCVMCLETFTKGNVCISWRSWNRRLRIRRRYWNILLPLPLWGPVSNYEGTCRSQSSRSRVLRNNIRWFYSVFFSLNHMIKIALERDKCCITRPVEIDFHFCASHLCQVLRLLNYRNQNLKP